MNSLVWSLVEDEEEGWVGRAPKGSQTQGAREQAFSDPREGIQVPEEPGGGSVFLPLLPLRSWLKCPPHQGDLSVHPRRPLISVKAVFLGSHLTTLCLPVACLLARMLLFLNAGTLLCLLLNACPPKVLHLIAD